MLYIEDIVFEQVQLDSAIERGHKNICLCDNSFNLPSADGMSYMAIGDVKAVIRLDRDRRYNINFENFTPVIIYTGGYTGITERVPESVIFPRNNVVYGSFGSYISSYLANSYFTSYGLGTYTLSGTSFGTFYKTSYITSYKSSYTSSYKALYDFGGSSHMKFGEPYVLDEKNSDNENIRTACEIFCAAGYGLNLI